MATIESPLTGIWTLDANIPGSTDIIKYGDDNIRGIKYAIRYTFPNINAIVTASVNQLNGVSPTFSDPTFTGTPATPTATPGSNNLQVASTAFVATACAAVVAGTFVDQLLTKGKIMFYGN